MQACLDTRHKTPYAYYQCYSARVQRCKNHNVKSDIVDEAVWKIITKICKNEKLLNKYIAEHQPQAKDNTESLKKELASIEAKRQAIMSWFSANLITADESTEKLQILKKQEKLIQEKLSTKTGKINTADIVSAAKGKLTFEDKRNFILQNISKVYVLRKDFQKISDVDLEINIIFRS